MDYMDLLVKQRMAIAQWRAKRDQEKAKKLTEEALLETDIGREVGT